jgi:hypothetical protein
MPCFEVAFAHGLCRIEVAPRTTDLDVSFLARMWLIEDDGHARRPLVASGGAPLEVHGSTVAQVVGSATTFLEKRFGPLSEYAHVCEDLGHPPQQGQPFVFHDLP